MSGPVRPHYQAWVCRPGYSTATGSRGTPFLKKVLAQRPSGWYGVEARIEKGAEPKLLRAVASQPGRQISAGNRRTV